jgi:hypothetical protein
LISASNGGTDIAGSSVQSAVHFDHAPENQVGIYFCYFFSWAHEFPFVSDVKTVPGYVSVLRMKPPDKDMRVRQTTLTSNLA